jgi:hypothetical protein
MVIVLPFFREKVALQHGMINFCKKKAAFRLKVAVFAKFSAKMFFFKIIITLPQKKFAFFDSFQCTSAWQPRST